MNRPISGAPSYSTGGPSYNTGPGPQADMFSRRAGGTVPSGGYQVGGYVHMLLYESFSKFILNSQTFSCPFLITEI